MGAVETENHLDKQTLMGLSPGPKIFLDLRFPTEETGRQKGGPSLLHKLLSADSTAPAACILLPTDAFNLRL